MESTPKIRKSLLPLSFIYGLITNIRNRMFDWGVFSSTSFKVPVVCIGNITVGGTGKTPHTEYLIQILLQSGHKVAVLSRGYKRKSSGFILSDEHSTPKMIGDEPYQMKKKFPEAIVAVDGNRRRGIKRILETHPDVDIVLLDDAFQHRWVHPGIAILLMDYNRKVYEDKLLPAGSLREDISEMERANFIIVTKCPKLLSPMEIRIISKYLEPRPHQQLFFTDFRYKNIRPVFPDVSKRKEISLTTITEEKASVLLVTGIASNVKMIDDLKQYFSELIPLPFADHHHFNNRDINIIFKQFSEITNPNKLILVTEKDAVRLAHMKDMPEEIKTSLYYIPIEVNFLQDQQQTFNSKIIDYVRKNKPNSRLSKSGYDL
ncbi:MAG: tetraacyldisaccharide 4'-kinase [Bacteroidales bacterium]